MKEYNEYKDSGIEWIGEIPTHWGNVPLKYLSTIQNGSTPSSSEDNYWNGDINWVTTDDLGKLENKLITQTRRTISKEGYESCGTKIAPKGSVVISTRAPIGHLGILDIDACTNQGCKTILPIKIDSGFCFYCLTVARPYLESLGEGSTFKELPTSTLKSFNIPNPSIEGQKVISVYLDHKTSQIDKLISDKEKLIDLLNEERIAIINQAVTKGLDLNVPMNDSGIDWLGEIPLHWEVWKLSHAFRKIGSGTTPESGNPIYHENGTINWLNTGDLNDAVLTETSKKITVKALHDYSALKLFPANTVVIAMYGATIGKTSLVSCDITTNQACCVFYDSDIILNKFLFYWFISNKIQIINLSKGGGQPNISSEILKGLKVPCPGLKEQINIINFIESENTSILTLTSKIQTEIDLLKEYKTALISEVVTGKIDVRDEVINKTHALAS